MSVARRPSRTRNVVQRWLRGWALYVGLVGVVVALFAYARGAQMGPWVPSHVAMEGQPRLTDQWWMHERDADLLRAVTQASPAVQALILLLGLIMTGLIFGGIGLTLWAVASGRIKAVWQGPFRRPPPWTLGEFFRIALLMVLIATLLQFTRLALIILWPGWWLDGNLWTNLSTLGLQVMLVMTILAFAAGKTSVPLRAVGLSLRRAGQAIATGLGSYVALFPWLLLLLTLVVQLAEVLKLQPPVEPIHQMIFGEQRPALLSLTAMLACLGGPVAEEVFFRGVLFAALRQRISRWPAMLLSSALFAASHTNLLGFLPIMVLGCLLADLYERTGSLLSSIAVHVVHNSLLLALALTYRALLG